MEKNPAAECNKIQKKFYPELFSGFGHIADPRNSSYIRYSSNVMLVLRCVNSCDIALAIYARSTPTKLAVGSTTPSLRGRTPDADIKLYIIVIYAMQY